MPKPKLLPGWLTAYHTGQLPGDLVAAMVVTLLLVPQGLAYAALAGLPAQLGLYASLLPLVAYAVFGSSMVMSVGPVAVISLMTAAALMPIAAPGSSEYIAGAILLSLLSGVMLFAFGLLRLGAMAQFLSHPVISGFISGAALLIIIGQLRPLLGIASGGESAIELGMGLVAELGSLQLLTAAFGVGTFILLLFARKGLVQLLTLAGIPAASASLLAKLMPIVTVLGSASLVMVMDWQEQIAVVGTLPGGLPQLAIPAIDVSLVTKLWLPALAIGLIGFVESVSIAQAFASKNRQRIDTNAELRGLGAANIVSAFSGAFPVTGGFSRTAVNADAGAHTPLAGVLAAILVALVLVFATGLFQTLPMAVLAATIVISAIGLVDIKSLLHNWHYDRAEGLAQAGTMLGVLLAGVEVGIVTGIALSLATLVWRASRPHIAIVGLVPGTEHFRNVNRYEVETRSEILILRVDENLFFGNAEAVEKFILRALDAQPEAMHVVLVMSSVSSIDATALDMLDMLNARLIDLGMQLHLAEVKGPVRDQLEHDHFPERLGGEIFLSTFRAYEALGLEVMEELQRKQSQ
ncbi:MAG: sulfate:proton symporter [Gammaproteobacteria bacterium BRH_c0]|nr:MAG: sulfate:proton symporter [Gammaproteobacteria bacterium BRH_c0]